MKTIWSNIIGTYNIKLDIDDDNNICDANLERILPLKKSSLKNGNTIIIDFLSSGYYDAGVIYGKLENCYPPEGEDERTLVEAFIIDDKGNKTVLSNKIQNQLFEMYKKEIDAVLITENQKGEENDC